MDVQLLEAVVIELEDEKVKLNRVIIRMMLLINKEKNKQKIRPKLA